jgi:glutamate N-acetyltransferase/amino-acid N-acetyltransferase
MSVVAAQGFTAAGVACGIKPEGLDLAVVLADGAVAAAGVFTMNQAAAAPVQVSRSHLATSRGITGLVINSGCANAATGATGRNNALRMTEAVANATSNAPSSILVCSTGTIGPQLPIDNVVAGIEAAVELADDTNASGTSAGWAILTTDSVAKQATHRGDGWVVGGMAKGAGMVRPNLATMLAVITTDAVVDSELLRSALTEAVDGSFNSLNIDGCESTNDSVIALASGSSGVAPDEREFVSTLSGVCRDLALQMARDAEGASRVVTIEVRGAFDDAVARSLGRLVADSALVRSSFYGGDVNWGRVLGALGSTDIPLDLEAIDVSYQGVTVFSEGVGASYDENALLAECEHGELRVGITVGQGAGTAQIVTTDLTPDYVVFNGERS